MDLRKSFPELAPAMDFSMNHPTHWILESGDQDDRFDG